MDRAEKKALVADLNAVFQTAGVVVVTRYSGMTVAQMNDLRRQMGAVGATFKVTKNRLTKLALEGTPCADIADLFTGPTALAWSADPVAAAKVATEYAKKNDKFGILGGSMGRTVLDETGVKALAALPSLDELRASLVGMISTPATRVAAVIAAPAAQIARVIGAYADKADQAEAA